MKKKYTNDDITVVWKPELCVHSGICVGGLPQVFDPKARPWINISNASSEEIVAQVNQCPSGALSILSQEQTVDSGNMEKSRIDILKDGPVKVTGPVKLTLSDASEQVIERDVFLCRCGHSANKPFCDGSHKRIGFSEQD